MSGAGATPETAQICAILRDAYQRPRAKRIARDAGCSIATARRIAAGNAAPDAHQLLRMAARNAALAESLCRELNRYRENA